MHVGHTCHSIGGIHADVFGTMQYRGCLACPSFCLHLVAPSPFGIVALHPLPYNILVEVPKVDNINRVLKSTALIVVVQ